MTLPRVYEFICDLATVNVCTAKYYTQGVLEHTPLQIKALESLGLCSHFGNNKNYAVSCC